MNDVTGKELRVGDKIVLIPPKQIHRVSINGNHHWIYNSEGEDTTY
jgi:DNA-binding LytR/AlgR family response regulator